MTLFGGGQYAVASATRFTRESLVYSDFLQLVCEGGNWNQGQRMRSYLVICIDLCLVMRIFK